MKKLLFTLSLLTLLSTAPVMGQGKHRHHPHTEQVAEAADSLDDENVAYSDTASADAEEFQPTVVSQTDEPRDPLSMRNYDNPFSFFVALFSVGVGGIILALLIILFVFMIIFGPFILLFMLIRYFIRRHDDRVALAEKAMEAGNVVPERMKPIDRQGDEYMWKRGVKNSAIGFGLMVMFSFWNADALVGIGALVLCIGIGQMVIARTTTSRKHDDAVDDDSSVESRAKKTDKANQFSDADDDLEADAPSANASTDNATDDSVQR